MKILIMHNSGARHLSSGETRAVENEANALKKMGVDIKVNVVYNEASGWRHLFKFIRTGFGIFYSPASYKLTAELLDQFQPDLVHFHGIIPILTPSALHLCHKQNVPVVQTLHNFRWLCVEGGLFRRNRICCKCLISCGWQGVFYGCAKGSRLISLALSLTNMFYRRSGYLYRWVDKFIAVSEFVKDTYISAGFPAEKMTVKYNGINPASKAGNVDVRRGITFVGRLTRSKGTEILARLFSRINCPFNIIGTGQEGRRLKAICQEINFNHVKFWGNLSPDETNKIIASSVGVIIPSQCGETFSLVAAEAMLNGTPIIVSAFGGPKELVEKSGAGIVVEPRDADGFVAAIMKLLNQSVLADQMGKKGQQFVQQKLNQDKTTAQLIKIYEQVIADTTKSN